MVNKKKGGGQRILPAMLPEHCAVRWLSLSKGKVSLAFLLALNRGTN